ncbi:hypothetical protein PQI07_25610 [Methylobacterium sp. 092160098-2]|uniref:hypothetical protein n=1 Tax=Methylobacterium sp. 092160098-2 TaxID=3025129 RepID=UPI002381BF49|nr:hypothetical protein [Methylobacterium sp. 092160098-2]MDE4914052.1 hypothetical protein [Methylobacterium sp. 092160098-2]
MSGHVPFSVRVYYRAGVVPRNGRLVRELPFRAEIPLAIRSVASAELEVAAVAVLAKNRGRYEYLRHGSRLYVPVRTNWMPDAPPMDAATAIANIEAGRELHRQNAVANPFSHLGPRWMMSADRERAVEIERMALRSVAWDELDAVSSEAARLASEFLVDDLGRLLRASPGPHWTSFNVWSVEPNECLYEAPRGVPAAFHWSRGDEAFAYLRTLRSRGRQEVLGAIEVADPSVLPDRDAANVAYGLLNGDIHRSLATAALKSGSSELADLGERVVHSLSVLYGADPEVLADPRFRWAVPHGMDAPCARELAGFVEDVRLLVEAMRGRAAGLDVEGWSEASSALHDHSIRRWDEYEAPRLPTDPGPPDLSFEGPTP